jgi:hypothetical protein
MCKLHRRRNKHDDGGPLKLAIQIAAGIVIAAAVIFVGMHLYLLALAHVATEALEEAQRQVQTEVVQMHTRIEAQQQEGQRRAERAKRAQLEADAAQLRAKAAVARAEQETAARKAAAWATFYQPAKKCDNPSDWDIQVQCGNAHIRAQREFEAQWAAGEL